MPAGMTVPLLSSDSSAASGAQYDHSSNIRHPQLTDSGIQAQTATTDLMMTAAGVAAVVAAGMTAATLLAAAVFKQL